MSVAFDIDAKMLFYFQNALTHTANQSFRYFVSLSVTPVLSLLGEDILLSVKEEISYFPQGIRHFFGAFDNIYLAMGN